jgi:hypothetical protein
VAGSCAYGDDPLGSSTMELVKRTLDVARGRID